MVLKVYHVQKRAFLFTVHGVNWHQHRRNCRIGKRKKMVFCIEEFVLIKVLRHEKGYDNWWIITLLHRRYCERAWVCVFFAFWTSNWKHVIKYDIFVKFSRIFAHNVEIRAKFSCKNSTDVCPLFWILRQYTWGGRFFVDTQTTVCTRRCGVLDGPRSRAVSTGRRTGSVDRRPWTRPVNTASVYTDPNSEMVRKMTKDLTVITCCRRHDSYWTRM